MTDTKQILKEVRKIEISTKHLVDGILQGAYHSVFKGRGIEFSEVREYVPGDDVRTIDWKVTARMDHPFVKEFIEERDLSVYILLDISGSNEFGSIKSKKRAAVELSASLMFAALRNNDKVGLCLFTDRIEKHIPPRKGKKQVLRLVREMAEYSPEQRKTDLREPLRFIAKAAKKKSIVFVVSDFFSEDFYKEMKLLRNRHDVIAVNINDIREQEMPDIGYIELEDEETGEQILLDTSDEDFRKNYKNMMKEKSESLSKMFAKLRVDSIQINSEENYEVSLRKFFRKRLLRR